MTQPTPTADEIASGLRSAETAVTNAANVRQRYRRRRLKRRGEQLTAARDRCVAAAAPLRSWIGMVAWHDLPLETELAMKDAISALRYERRQITKMLDAS
jgi:hypothetical protein